MILDCILAEHEPQRWSIGVEHGEDRAGCLGERHVAGIYVQG